MALLVDQKKSKVENGNGTVHVHTEAVVSATSSPQKSYTSVQRIKKTPLVQKSVQVYDENIEPMIQKVPFGVGTFVLSAGRSVINYGQENVLPVAGRVVEPFHGLIDGTANRVIDGAELVGSAVMSTEKRILGGMDSVVDVVENVVDWALPSPTQSQARSGSPALVNGVGEEFENSVANEEADGDVDENAEMIAQLKRNRSENPAPFLHAYHLSLKTAQRLLSIVASHAPSKDNMAVLKSTRQLLHHYQVQLQESTQKLQEAMQQAQHFLAESIEKRVGTPEERSQMLNNTKNYINAQTKPTLQKIYAVQNKLVEAVTEVKTVITSLMMAMFNKVDSNLPFGIKSKVEYLVSGFRTKWDQFSKTIAHPLSPSRQAKKKTNQDGEQESSAEDDEAEYESLMDMLRQTTSRAVDLNTLSNEGLEMLKQAKQVVDGYYSYATSRASDVLHRRVSPATKSNKSYSQVVNGDVSDGAIKTE
ncbi:hypothetical protein MP228_010369 [Amoeboaphelidium protococcarum]|nr:hypothetical protein MP228_010369 [Amoeboaphelidium protococcarum]